MCKSLYLIIKYFFRFSTNHLKVNWKNIVKTLAFLPTPILKCSLYFQNCKRVNHTMKAVWFNCTWQKKEAILSCYCIQALATLCFFLAASAAKSAFFYAFAMRLKLQRGLGRLFTVGLSLCGDKKAFWFPPRDVILIMRSTPVPTQTPFKSLIDFYWHSSQKCQEIQV